MKVNIECMNILRQKDGQIIIQNDKKQIQSSSNDDSSENLRQLEIFRLENERLRSELDTHKTEIKVLRGERDSLINTISKLDTELTQAENQRVSQKSSKKK